MSKRNRVLVLCYHRINILEQDINKLAVTPINFEQHILWLKKNFEIVRFEEEWKGIERDAVAITFDDGYMDFYQNALPILEQYHIPATVFIATGTMDQKREFWWDELEDLIFNGNDIPPFFHLEDKKFDYTWVTSNYEYRKSFYQSLHFLIKNCADIRKREEWFEQLWSWRGRKRKVREEYFAINSDICKKIIKSPLVTIGAHTVSHPALKYLTEKEQKKEIEESIERLENIVKQPITVFSYPFGKKNIDYNDFSSCICKKMEIKKTAATNKGMWDEERGNYDIYRNGVRDMELFDFIAYVNNIKEI